jgi:CheY-like chemotaxis protein
MGYISQLKSAKDRNTGLFDEQLHLAQESGENLERFIAELWTVSLIESEQVCMSKEIINLRDYLPFWEDLIRRMACEKGVILQFSSFATIQRVCMDLTRFQQILLNLVNNAIKFNQEGGRVRVNLTITEEEERVRIDFTVSDTGRGIPDHLLNQVFEKFFQCKEEDFLLGSGIGLFLCKQFVQLMGGQIHCKIEKDNPFHTNFIGHVFVDRPPELPEDEFFHSRRVLVAEDSDVNLKLLLHILRGMGVDPIVSMNGKQAVEMFERCGGEIEVILMDIQMPEMDGIEATVRIRERQREMGRHIPIIAVTAGVTPLELERLQNAGMDGWVAKPIKREELKRKIFEALRTA